MSSPINPNTGTVGNIDLPLESITTLGTVDDPEDITKMVSKSNVVIDLCVGDEQRIELRAEELLVHKERVQISKVSVRKEVITEMRTIQVPVQREELVIERYLADDLGNRTIETTRIPLAEERVTIDKQQVVLEEVTLRKQEVTQVERISVTLLHEELRIDGEGQTK